MASPKPVTSAIIFDESGSRILLVRNKKNPKKDCFGFSGGVGGFELYSDPYKAVQQEVRGDIGCEFTGEFVRYEYRSEDNVATLFFKGLYQENRG